MPETQVSSASGSAGEGTQPPRIVPSVAGASPGKGSAGPKGELARPPIPPSASPVAAGPPQRPSKVRKFFGRLEDRLFPERQAPPPNRSGLLRGWPPEPYALIIATAIAVVFAEILEFTIGQNPIPPGGDPGEWMTTSYAFVGLPYPSWIIPGQYPPLLFPLLGLLVRIGGGPLMGARLYLLVISILIGLSSYVLTRSLVRSPPVALVVEALILFNPTFMQLFFFGAYPNLFGLVFLNLCIAFLARYLRSRRGLHLILFWSCAAAAVLSHSLVGAILGATIGIAALFLLWLGRIPRATYRTRAGWIGIGIFAGSVGGFYLITKLLRIPHPNYLSTNSFAFIQGGMSLFFQHLFSPYFHGVHPSVNLALLVLILISGGLAIALVALRLFAPNRLSISVLLVSSMALAVTVLSLVGWEMAVLTDYSRFAYFLVTPAMIAFGLTIDAIITQLRIRSLKVAIEVAKRSEQAASPSASSSRSRRRFSPTGARLPPGTFPTVIILALAVAGTLAIADAYALPSFASDETNNTTTSHDQSFVAALHDIQNSGYPGNVLTVPGAAKWARAILDRNAYAPLVPGRFTFDATHLDVEEAAYFAMTDSDAVTNSLVAVTTLGTNMNMNFSNDSPTYQAASFGSFDPLVTLPESKITVTLVDHRQYLTETLNMTPSLFGPLAGSPSSMAMLYSGPGFTLNITMTAIPDSSRAVISVLANQTGSYPLAFLNASLVNPVNGTSHFGLSSAKGEAVIVPAGESAGLTTFANVTPVDALGHVARYSTPGRPANAAISESADLPLQGANNLSFVIALNTPAALNQITNLPPFISTTAWWASMGIQFILYVNASTAGQRLANFLYDEVPYLQGEFGCTVLANEGAWTVVLVPTGL
jgi:hypothetical protein